LNNCNQLVKNYSIYLRPITKTVALNDVITYNIAFEGDQDYIISFCADSTYYPIHYRVFNSKTKKELYNNESDNYYESIGIRVYYTQNMVIEATLMADKIGKKEKKEMGKVCIGLIMHLKKKGTGND